MEDDKIVTVEEAEAAMFSSSGYPDDKCVTHGELDVIADRQPIIMSLPQGDKLTDASVVIDDDHSVRIIDTTDTVIDSSLSFYGFTPVSDLPLSQPCNVHYKYFIDNAEVLQESAVMSSPYSKIFTRSSSKLKGIIDSSFYDSSVGMEVSVNSGKFLTLEYRGSRNPGVDASYGFAVQYAGSSTQSTNSMLLFGVGMRGYGISLLQFGAGQIMNALPGFFAHRLPGPFRNDSLTTITADKYPAFQRTLTAEDFSDAGTDRIRIQQMAFLLMNPSGALIGNAYVSYDIYVNKTSYARTQIPVNTTTSSSSINWTTINPIEITLGDSLTMMFQIVFEDN